MRLSLSADARSSGDDVIASSRHSAALFLSIHRNVHVLTFDKFDRPYQPAVLEKLQQTFPGRLKHVKGNSCKTVPQFLSGSDRDHGDGSGERFAGCDFLHGSSLCPTDNIDLVQHATCGTILTSTAMHSLSDAHVYFGPNAQWRQLRDAGCIADIRCYREEQMRTKKTYIFAVAGQTIQHEFCFARVTGACNRLGSDQGGDCKVGVRVLRDVCPEIMIEPPA